MAVPPSLSYLKQGTGSQTLEFYLDLLCPFSRKQAHSLEDNVLPHVRKGGKYEGKLSVITWIYAQPFHYTSPIHTEAVLVFGKHHPDLFWKYTLAVFDGQEAWYNVPSASLTADQIRDQLADLAIRVLEDAGQAGKGPKSKVYGEFRSAIGVREKEGGSKNGGTEVFDAFKHVIKIGRQNSIHVTPTALFDGLIDNSVSSSWGKAEWDKYLAEKLGA